MPIIVDASIQGKLDKPIMPNVTSANDKPDFNRGTSGITETTSNNTQKLSREKGIPVVQTKSIGATEGVKMANESGADATVSVMESSKGLNINAKA